MDKPGGIVETRPSLSLKNLPKRIYRVGHALKIVAHHHGTQWQAKNLTMDLFGKRKRRMVEAGVRFLLMWGNRVMYQRFYALLP